jgi:hypothetical protein
VRGTGVVIGRAVFGIATLTFGIVTLAFPDYYDWLQLHWSTQAERAFGYAASATQVVGGAAIAFRPTAKSCSAILAIVYFVIAFLSVPRILAAPLQFYAYGDFFNQSVLALGGAAAYASLSEPAARHTFESFGRILFGICAASFTMYQALYLKVTAGLVPTWIPPNQMFWAATTTVLLALAAVALLVNRIALLATRLLTSMLLLFGIIVWLPLVIHRYSDHFDWTEASETFAIAGATWVFSDLLASHLPVGRKTLENPL